ncbi:MAG: tRNA pseudouridine(55) synthase TruB, partial [Flavobacterium sp.]|nr:tRNA pseudouridine(55) synthase TruB [Aeromicrobium sp.]
AIKVDGVRSYAGVRSGEAVEPKARAVTVSELELGPVRVVGDVVDIDVRVVCSSGTYVRALARDIGRDLGVGGHLTMLRRTRVGGFTIGQARTLEQLAESLTVVGLDDVARASFASYELDETGAADVRFGRSLREVQLGAEGAVAVFAPTGGFLALYEQRGPDARPVAVFV